MYVVDALNDYFKDADMVAGYDADVIVFVNKNTGVASSVPCKGAQGSIRDLDDAIEKCLSK